MITEDDERGARWQRRGGLAWLLRTTMTIVPLGLSVAMLIICGRLLPRPHGGALFGWYAGLFAASWVALWFGRRLLHRLLPLAALLELTLSFPESAPSRLTLAKKSVSTRDLAALLDAPAEAPEQETTQQAAERILTLMAALAHHDRHTRGHAERVRAYTDLIAGRVGLARRDRDKLQWAALLHDIGKLAIPAVLLNKPAKPNPREWELLKGHPEAGSRIVAPLMDWLGEWGEVIAQHHEHYDGGGYPRGLSGHGICRGARIVAVADSLEVMTAARPYKRPIRKDAAMRELVRCSGTQFDPDVIRALLAIPSRRLMLAMGPTAWLAGLPFIGQAPAQLVMNLATSTAASAGAVAVVATTVNPAAAGLTPPAASTTQPAASTETPTAAVKSGPANSSQSPPTSHASYADSIESSSTSSSVPVMATPEPTSHGNGKTTPPAKPTPGQHNTAPAKKTPAAKRTPTKKAPAAASKNASPPPTTKTPPQGESDDPGGNTNSGATNDDDPHNAQPSAERASGGTTGRH